MSIPESDPNSGKQPCAESASGIYTRGTRSAVHREPSRLTKFRLGFHDTQDANARRPVSRARLFRGGYQPLRYRMVPRSRGCP